MKSVYGGRAGVRCLLGQGAPDVVREKSFARHTFGLVPSVEDMTNWGGDYLNGQAVVGASCPDNGAIDDLERLFFRVAPRRPDNGVAFDPDWS